jgi:hypothetical protein
MLCYKDRKHCSYYKECRYGHFCTQALTDEVVAKAKSFGLPVCEYADYPQCFESITQDNPETD